MVEYGYRGTRMDGTVNEEEDTMGRIVVTEFMSLDGVDRGPGRKRELQARRLELRDRPRRRGRHSSSSTRPARSEALLLGRVTYEGFAEAWPSRDGEFADKFNSMPKYVVSSTLEQAEWNNSTVLKGDLAE